MRKYYLFTIKKEFKAVYYNNAKVLYQTMYNLYKLPYKDYKIGLSIYNQICMPFNKKLLINYFKNKFSLKDYKDKYCLINKDEKIFICFNYSCVIIYSNRNIPSVFKYLYLYNKNIFVVDFDNNDYFWLIKDTIR